MVKEQPLAGSQLILEPSSPHRSWSSLESSSPPIQCPSPLLPTLPTDVVKSSNGVITPSEVHVHEQVHELGEPTYTASDMGGLGAAKLRTGVFTSRHGTSPPSRQVKLAHLNSTIRVSSPSTKAQQAVLYASTAMKHLLEHEEELFRVFEQHGVPRNLVHFMAGFDQTKVMLGIGLQEEIYVVSQVELTDPKSCLRQLGEILSPFFGSVETPTSSFTTPVIEVRGTECTPFEHEARRTRRISEAARDRIKLADTVSILGPGNENGGSGAQGNLENSSSDSYASGDRDGGNHQNLPVDAPPTSLAGEGGRENLPARADGKGQNVDGYSKTPLQGVAGDLPPEPPGSTKTGNPSSVFFECVGRVYPGKDIASPAAHYIHSVQTSGLFSYEILGDAASSHCSRVKFSYLELQSTPGSDDPNIKTRSYEITHSQVAVDALQERTRCIIHQPASTSEGESIVKQTRGRKTTTSMSATGTGGTSGLHPTGTVAVTPGRSTETTTTREQVTSLNRVLKFHERGKVLWLYKADDSILRREYKFPQELLPDVEFVFFREVQSPPRHIQVRVGSLRTLSEQSQIELTGPCYRNIVHWVQLIVPSVLANDVEYQDVSKVGVGSLLPSEGESGEVKVMSTVHGVVKKAAADCVYLPTGQNIYLPMFPLSFITLLLSQLSSFILPTLDARHKPIDNGTETRRTTPWTTIRCFPAAYLCSPVLYGLQGQGIRTQYLTFTHNRLLRGPLDKPFWTTTTSPLNNGTSQ